MYNVLIRPLIEKDSEVSFKWRNDKDIWEFTGERPNQIITHEIELDWIKKVLDEKDSKRFGIIANEEYIGNIQFTNVDLLLGIAQFHVFIGEKSFWRKGISFLAIKQILFYGKEVLKLNEIYLYVNILNKNAISLYNKLGFKTCSDEIKMTISLNEICPPSVSVFMITYNHEKFIGKAIESVLMQQTNFDFEIIIGVDFGTDKTIEICELYQKKFPGKIKILSRQKRVGAWINQIETLTCCKGIYIALLEGDDYWTDKSKLQKQFDFLELNQDFSFCFTDRSVVDLDDKVLDDFNVDEKYKRTFQASEMIGSYTPPTQTIMFRSSLLTAKVLNSEILVYNGDTFLFWYLVQFGKAGYINENTANYRVTGEGVYTSISNMERLEQRLNTYHNLENILETENIKLLFKTKMKTFSRLFVIYFRQLKLFKALKIYSKIFFLDLKWRTLYSIKALRLLLSSKKITD